MDPGTPPVGSLPPTSWSTRLSTISARYPPHQQAAAADLAGSGPRDSTYSREAEGSGAVESLTIDQYHLVRREADQRIDRIRKAQDEEI
ncbi:unnamed protein product [Phytophthora lilii]|uniref:Unnamed protein product n=1 Tax=Phytophthora lilii TaxID=2077276 RepID=A0A9W6TEE3_9STRA|nr:unnamed protein product [Phytophthora lilii]